MSKSNVRGLGTADKLVEVAEHLFGLRGVEAVSLREIGQAAGSSNKFAVQYYFGGKEGLLRAIFEYRLPALDQRRGEFLDALRRDDRTGDVRGLLEALLRPLCEQHDAEGRRSYAAFLSRLWGFTTKLELRIRNNDLTPHTAALFSLLRAASPIADRSQFEIRMILVVSFFLNSLGDYEGARLEGYNIPFTDQEIIDDILEMTVTAFLTPLPSAGQAVVAATPAEEEATVPFPELAGGREGSVQGRKPHRIERHAPEDKARMVLEALRGKTGVTAIAGREGISEASLVEWIDEFTAGGRRQLAQPTLALTSEISVDELRLRAQLLEKLVVDQALEIQFLKASRLE